MKHKEKFLRVCASVLFVTYFVVLIRIILFKQVALYNLVSAIGAAERTVNMIPFQSLFDMINTDTSITRILENILGNVTIFIPFGLLLPIVQRDQSKRIILYGLITSALFEIIQFIFALGSSDIDDLILNTSGTFLGYVLYKIIRKKSHTDTACRIAIIVLVTVFGSASLGVLFVKHTELFMLSPKETVIENENLVQDFIDIRPTVSGKFVEINENILTVEKNVHSSSDARELVSFEVTPNSNIYVRYNKITFFFRTISREQISYEQMEYADLLSKKSNLLTKGENVQIWSADGKTVDHLLIIESVE